MQYTANYNLNLPEGTDIVNPLVDYNPNFTAIDGAMKANANRTVGRATCVKSGTTHVVTRSNTDSPIINFTATGDWNTGDTMTIDSTVVSVFLPDGSAALDGAYVINSEVFGILNGTRFTLYGAQDIPVYTAADISYNNTGSGLTAVNVQGAIDELASGAVKLHVHSMLITASTLYDDGWYHGSTIINASDLEGSNIIIASVYSMSDGVAIPSEASYQVLSASQIRFAVRTKHGTGQDAVAIIYYVF